MKAALGKLILLALLGSVLAACGTLPASKQKRATALDASISAYRKLIRWGYYDEAEKVLRKQDGTPIEADLERASRYRVTSYTIKQQLMADNGREARVVALIEYYELDSGVIHSLRDEQLWWYDDEAMRWYVAAPLPAFGAPPAAHK